MVRDTWTWSVPNGHGTPNKGPGRDVSMTCETRSASDIVGLRTYGRVIDLKWTGVFTQKNERVSALVDTGSVWSPDVCVEEVTLDVGSESLPWGKVRIGLNPYE